MGRAPRNEGNQRDGLSGGVGPDQAPRMVELDARPAARRMNGGGQAGKSLDEFVRGDADAGEVTAPLGLNSRRRD